MSAAPGVGALDPLTSPAALAFWRGALARGRGGADGPGAARRWLARAGRARGGAACAWGGVRLARFLAWRSAMLARFPGPRPSLLHGNLCELQRAGGLTAAFLEQVHASGGGRVCGFWPGPASLAVSVEDPALQLEVLSQCGSRPGVELGLERHDELLGRAGESEQVRLQYARVLGSAQQLAKLHFATREALEPLSRAWGEREGGAVDVAAELAPALYDAVGTVLLNLPWGDHPKSGRILELSRRVARGSAHWAVRQRVPPVWDERYQRFLLDVAEWRRACGDLLDMRRADVTHNPEKYAQDESALTLLAAEVGDDGRPLFSKRDAVSAMCGLLRGAHETTHAAAVWLLYHLASNQGSQYLLSAELDALAPAGKMPSAHDLRGCERLEATLLESMRLRATVPIVSRVNLDHDIELGGLAVPKGTQVVLPLYRAFTQVDVFGVQADKFIPERFMGPHPMAHNARRALAAFGADSRQCPGAHFARAQLKCIVAAVLSKFSVHLVTPGAQRIGDGVLEAGVNHPDLHLTLRLVKRRLP